MKKLFLLAVAAMLSMGVYSQNVQRQGMTFIEQKANNTKSEPTKTQYTYKDSKGKVYPIYLSKNGRAFVYKTSAKTGKQYKYYMTTEVSKTICKELGVKYVETKIK